MWGGGQVGCEQRIKIFCENSKKKIGGGASREGGGSGWWGGGQGGCERRIEVFGKIKKKLGGGGRGGVVSGGGGGGGGGGWVVGGVKVDVNEELKFL